MLPTTTKICLVTGGTQGIGAAIVRRLAAEGHRVFTCSRHGEGVPDRVHHTAVDLSQPHFAWAWVHKIARDAGRLDLVVNNAAIYATGNMRDMSPEEAIRMATTNFVGAVAVASEAVKHLSATGLIVNVVSRVVLKKNIAGRAVYAATKAGMIEFTRGLVADGVKAIAWCPGLVSTRMDVQGRAKKCPEKAAAELLEIVSWHPT